MHLKDRLLIHPNLKKAPDLTAAISFHIAKDMMSVKGVKGPGFVRLMNVAVPHYYVPLQTFFSKTKQ